MVFLIDGLLILAIIISAYRGYKKGFVDVAIGFCSIFVIIFLIWLLAGPISMAILKTQKAKNLEKDLSYKIGEVLKKEDEKEKNTKKENELLDLVLKIKTGEKEKTNLPEYAASKLTETIVKVCVSILLYVILSLTFLIVNKLLTKALNTFQVSSMINGVGGLILNSIKTFIIIYLLLFAIKMLSPVMSEKVTKTINDTFITNKIYNNNYLVKKVVGDKK